MFIPKESLLGRTGGNIGQGLIGGLQQIGQQQQQARLADTLKALGLRPEAAGLPQDIRGLYVKQAMQEPANRAYAEALGNLFGVESQPQEPMVAAPQEGGIGSPIQKVPAQLNPQQATKLAELGLKKEEIESKRGKEAREFSAPYIEKARAAEKNINDYNKLIKLAQSGELRAGPKQQLLSKVGLGELGQNFETQLANKIMARLAQNIGSTFGGRVTNFLEQTFQKSLPTLWNTPQGIVAISKLNKYVDEVSLAEDKARRDLIKRTGGRLPANADDIIREQTSQLRNDLENKAMSVILTTSFPPAKNYSPDTVVEFEGNKFKKDGDDWVLVEEGA